MQGLAYGFGGFGEWSQRIHEGRSKLQVVRRYENVGARHRVVLDKLTQQLGDEFKVCRDRPLALERNV
jgi:hypothetical protein